MALNQSLKHVYMTGSGVAINAAAKVRLVILTAPGAAAGTLVLSDNATVELNLACVAGASVVVAFPGESGRQFGTNVTLALGGAGVVADIYYEN